ncbi:DUF1553 domain-containing protein [Planctomycetota bacterium]|nr:DUF1553 domain-containing protein [Planctomycetota bacterium]
MVYRVERPSLPLLLSLPVLILPALLLMGLLLISSTSELVFGNNSSEDPMALPKISSPDTPNTNSNVAEPNLDDVDEPSRNLTWCDVPLDSQQLRQTLDQFWFSRLDENELTPPEEASPEQLLRRLHYVVTGLPPTPEELESFLNDTTENRWNLRIENLLASEQYGVHWARHWLDLVRWAETDSYERDRLKPGAWRYRDWVVDAFNSDMPYDQFIISQLAGDELENESLDQHVATGFLHLGVRNDEPADLKQAIFDDLDSMLDTTCRSMLGISMGCARCHDHKGDPIPTRDYYRMLSFFEGMKPYKTGGGNGINTTNFVRDLPIDLGSSNFDESLESWKREHSERHSEITHLLEEVSERWGEEILTEANNTTLNDSTVYLDFNQPPHTDSAKSETTTNIEYEEVHTQRGTGKNGSPSLSLAGTGYVSIPRPVQDNFTISFWFKTDRLGRGNNRDLRWILGSGLVDGEISGIVPDFGISLVADHVCAGVGDPEVFIHGPGQMNDNQWHHVCFTRNMETGRIALWTDGVERSSATGSKKSLNRPEKINIGRMLPGAGSLQGEMDDVVFWNRVLSSREIIDLSMGGGTLPEHVQLVSERLGKAEGQRLEQAIERLIELKRPTREFVQVLSAQEQKKLPKSYIRIRGAASALGDEVTPGFPQILGGADASIEKPTDGESSGRRLTLARWIANEENPRTARVMANRVWQHVFGEPIVPTPNDFGIFGLPPSDAQLLDKLALDLVESGWSIKSLLRSLLNSSVFRSSGRFHQGNDRTDPGNRHNWKFRGRRLSAEEIRDSILSFSGDLNLKMGGPGVYPPLPEEVLATSSRPDSVWNESSEEDSSRRSIYIHVKRSLLHPLLQAFDMADTDNPCPVRFNTIQPTQALTLLNSDFSERQAISFADRLENEHSNNRDRIRSCMLIVSQKIPAPHRVDENLTFFENLKSEHELNDRQALEIFCLMALNLNETVHID